MNYLYTEGFLPFTVNDQPVIEVTFRTRDFAEAAVRHFTNFHGRQLTMSFTPPADDNSTSSPSASYRPRTSTDSIAVTLDSGDGLRQDEKEMDEGGDGFEEDIESCKHNLVDVSDIR